MSLVIVVGKFTASRSYAKQRRFYFIAPINLLFGKAFQLG
ncbi:Uncharacterised protein [Plesiomonas shigelloides]|nr:Uncharacterised protein [Plesiomonas shigelloides]